MGSMGTTNGNGVGHGAAAARRRQHAEGPAAVLGIGTANPTGVEVPQDIFAENLFRVTKSDHLTELQQKLTRICEKSGIDKRHFHLTEETLVAHPELYDQEAPSLDNRIAMTVDAVPKLAQCAAAKAIAEWGRPASEITHLVFSTYSAWGAPSADLRLATLLGLRPTVSRTILSLHGCYGGGRALNLARELAENNRGARVLVACAEITLVCFREGEQSPIFEMVHATQTTVPKTEHALGMQVSGSGVDFHLAIQVPTLIGQNVERCLLDAFRGGDDDDGAARLPSPLSGNGKWNDLFWAVHPGGRPILDNIDKVFQLEPEKLAASRHVLREYGNMSGATIVFVLDELRRRRSLLPEWGAMLAFGPGITIETMVLRCPR